MKIPIKVDWSKWTSFKKAKKTIRKVRRSLQAKKALKRYLKSRQYEVVYKHGDEYIFEDVYTGVQFKFTKNGDVERINKK